MGTVGRSAAHGLDIQRAREDRLSGAPLGGGVLTLLLATQVAQEDEGWGRHAEVPVSAPHPQLENGCAGQRTGLDGESRVHNFPSAMTCDLQEDVLTRGCGQLGESRGLAEPRP